MKFWSAIAYSTLGAIVFVEAGCGLCTEVACVSAITTTVTISGGVEPLEGAVARVCREQQCLKTGFVVNLDQASCEGASNGELSVSCNVGPEGNIAFTIELSDQDAEDEEDYSIIVNGSDGAELGTSSGVVTYEKTEPNGDGCGYCYSGSF